MKFEMPAININYFERIHAGGEVEPLMTSDPTNAAITGNQFMKAGANTAAARTARVQTIIQLNRQQ